MKHFVTLLLNLTVIAGLAQCTFTPTISPNSVILCPNSSEVLTTEVCDSYQWYKDGSPIPGATQQTHSVSYFEDGGSSFSVEATLDGCTEMSASVLVDGWVFLLPFAITDGDPPYAITENGAFYCTGDTAFLILDMPYDPAIQWTNNGAPMIGATDDTLVVTKVATTVSAGLRRFARISCSSSGSPSPSISTLRLFRRSWWWITSSVLPHPDFTGPPMVPGRGAHCCR
ncbi:MAG: hypothetical protein IPG69_11235 [Flavobacteriales bacterium]|nr:hypothetical protein [Flavobacteriales bacterium]